jgi:hypothetical protein
VSWASVRGKTEVCAEVGEAVRYLVKCAYGVVNDDGILDERIDGMKKEKEERKWFDYDLNGIYNGSSTRITRGIKNQNQTKEDLRKKRKRKQVTMRVLLFVEIHPIGVVSVFVDIVVLSKEYWG